MSTIDLKEIKFKELSAAVVALNNSECFKGKEKIATVGVSKIALVEAFLAAVENVPDNEKGEWTGPEAAGDYYNKIVVVEDSGVVEVTEKEDGPQNEIKEIIQTEEDPFLSNEVSDECPVDKQTGIVAKEISKVKKEKKISESSKEKDEFGFVKGSNRSLFCESLKESPGTMKEICAREWNKGKSLYNETFKIIETKGFAKKDAKTGILSIK